MSTMIKSVGIGAVSALALAATSAQAIDLQAGDTELSVYGYAQLNAAYDFDENLGGDNRALLIDPNNLNFDDSIDAEDGFFDMGANQSRFGISTATAVGGDTVMTQVEGDFVGGDFRLRHAYGSWNGILAGQTWSNYNSFVATTPVIDFNGAIGGAGTQARNAQIRYTVGSFSVALEELSANIAGTDGTTNVYKRELPDLSVKYEGVMGGVGYAAGAAVQFLNTPDEAGGESATGYGAFLAAAIELGTGTTLSGNLSYGDGVGVYLSRNPNAFIDADGDIETLEAIGGTIGLSQDIGPGAFNIVYGLATVDYPDAAGDSLEDQQVVLANYLWSPVTNVTYGVELAWLDAERVAGETADGTRLKFMARYSF